MDLKRLIIFLTAYLTAFQIQSQTAWRVKALNIDSLTSGYVRDISIVNQQVAWALVSNEIEQTTMHFAKTIDGGITWIPSVISIPDSFFSMSICGINKDTAWITAFTLNNRSSIFKTVDGGNNWIRQASGDLSSINLLIHFYDKNNGIAFDGRQLIRTNNGGDDWNKELTVFNLGAIFQDACHIRGDNIWIGDFGGKIIISNDRGKTWRSSSQLLMDNEMKPFVIKSISFSDNKNGLLIGWTQDSFQNSDDRIFYRTKDGGDTWQKVNFRNTEQLFKFGKWDIDWLPQSKSTFIISSGLGSAITRNFGESWQILSKTESFSCMEFLDSNIGFSGGFVNNINRGIYKWDKKSLSLFNNSKPLGIIIYPNPANDILYIESSNNEDLINVKIVNYKGVLVKSIEVSNCKLVELNISDLSPGIYTIIFPNSNFVMMKN